MCWNSNRKPNKRIADEDIHVYKIMHKNLSLSTFKAYFMNYEYTPNCLNNEIKLMVDKAYRYDKSTSYEIEYGYHSYSSGLSLSYSPRSKGYYINHLQYQHIDNSKYSLVIVECLIPKGSIYYKNEYGEFVSSNIIITDNYKIITDSMFSIMYEMPLKDILYPIN